MPTLTVHRGHSNRALDPSAFAALRAYVLLLQKISSSFYNQSILSRNHSAQVIYLVDFEVLFTIMAPFLDTEQSEEAQINQASAHEFFATNASQVALPPGTLAELGRFLSKHLANVQYLADIQQTLDLDRAVESFSRYLDVSLEDAKFDVAAYGEGTSRLINLQLQAVELLSQHEKALFELNKILESIDSFDLYDLVSAYPIPIPNYGDLFAEISKARRRERQKAYADKADALNLSFTYNLNVHIERLFLEEKLSKRYIFRLLTNTPTLHRINEREAQVVRDLTYRGPEYEELALVAGTEEASGANLFQSHFQDSTNEKFVTFRRLLAGSEVAVLEIEAAASRRRMAPVEILQQLLEPTEQEDRQLLIECKESVDNISKIVNSTQMIAPSIINRSLRLDLVWPNRKHDISAIPPGVSYDLSSLNHLVGSISKVLNKIDTLGFHLTEFQMGKFGKGQSIATPVMSLRSLGVELRRIEREQQTSFIFSRRQTGEVILVLDKLNTHWATSWVTGQSGPTSAEIFLGYTEAISKLGPKRVLKYGVTLIEKDGNQRHFSVAGAQIPEYIRETSKLAFFRIEAEDQAFTSELYTVLPGYVLRTGLIMKRINYRFIEDVFGATSTYRGDTVLCEVLKREVINIVSTGE